jgi:trehalose 6-phosphate phosphatase
LGDVAGPDAFDRFRACPERAAVLTDFDGTLSEIVEDWTAAAPLPGVRAILDDLARRYAVVGVISGRPVSFLHQHLGDEVRLSGLYGLEVMHRGERIPVEGAEEWRTAIDEAHDDARTHFGDLVEHKGLSLTIHFRTPPVHVDKGSVVELAAEGLEAACFLGDDVGDLPAFAALERLAERGMHTVKVAVATAEAPPAVLARADVVVDGPEGALEVLRSL